MSNIEKKCKITIVKDGPYLVSGQVPLSEKIIRHEGKVNIYAPGRTFPSQETYALCRCGQSKTHPFCDGSHANAHFNGTETAPNISYADRADTLDGPGLDLMDDNRCAFARFCHREDGSVWSLTEQSDRPGFREQAIRAAIDCPTGRLTAVDKDGNHIEPNFEPSIEILQDPNKGVSGPLFVKGNIPIESSRGFTYEIRNRVALCRCGKSRLKPFCDAYHIMAKFSDYSDQS